MLRRAPDNLAAIRGLAELHDRTEGALPSMDERESWRTDEASDAAEADPGLPSAPAAPTEDPFAPIAVTFASASTDPSPEIVHTAEDAQRAAQAAAAAAAALVGGDEAAPTLSVDSEPVAVMRTAGDLSGDPGESDPLAEAAASLDVEVTGFDPGIVESSSPTSVSFAPTDLTTTAGETDLQIDPATEDLLATFVGDADSDERAAALSWAGTSPDAAAALGDTAASVDDETDDLLATLQSFAGAEPAAAASDFVVDLSDGDEMGPAGSIEAPEAGAAAVSEPHAALEGVESLAFAPDTVRDASSGDVAGEAAIGQAEIDALDGPVIAEEPQVAGASLVEPASEDDVAGDTTVAALEAVDLQADQSDTALVETLESPVLRLEAAELAELPLQSEATDEVADGAFTPDLSFTLTPSEPANPAELLSGIPSDVEVEDQDRGAAPPSEPQPAFIPNLGFSLDSSELSALEAEGFAAPPAMAAPLSDVPAAAAEAEPAFVPDLNYALEPAAESVSEDTDATGVSAGSTDEPSPFAGLAAMASTVDSRPAEALPVGSIRDTRAPVAALERFLRKVESRRVQLASESVA